MIKTASIVFGAGPLGVAGLAAAGVAAGLAGAAVVAANVPLTVVKGTVIASETHEIAILRSSKRELRFSISDLAPYGNWMIPTALCPTTCRYCGAQIYSI